MATGKQVRAARQFLEWSATDLAENAGVSGELVMSFERGDRRPLQSSIEKIVRALEDAGIQFNGDTGVNLVGINFRILEGSDCYLRLLEEIYRRLKNQENNEVLSIGTDDSVSPREVVDAIQKWHDAGIKCRFLSHDKAKRFDFPLHEYRLIPSDHFKNSVMVIFDNYVATLRSSGQAVLVVQDRDNAEMLRGIFELLWEQSKTPKETSGRKK